MTEILSNPSWTGISAIVTILSLAFYILVEWKKLTKESRSILKKVRSINTSSKVREADKFLGQNPLIILLGGGPGIGVFLSGVIVATFASILTANSYWLFMVIVGGVPFWNGMNMIRNEPQHWALHLYKNFGLTILYLLSLMGMTILLALIIDNTAMEFIIGILEQPKQLVIILISEALVMGICLPLGWAATYQKMNNYFYFDYEKKKPK